MMCSFSDAVDELEADSQSIALVLRGSQGTFCAGASFDVFAENTSTVALRELGASMREVMVDATERISRLPLISVAVIDGHAIGGGAELATCTDFRIWAPGAKMRFVQAKMGITPGWGGAGRLAELVGRRQALRLLGAGASLDYDGARAIGLADGCAASDALEDVHAAANEFVGLFAAQPYPEAVRAIKAILTPPEAVRIPQPYLVAAHSQAQLQSRERDAFLRLWGGPDNLEAVRRFVGERPAKRP
jgi:ethylmalonyl-CoA/methylmalonyl-CoA decarboxylase